MTDEKLFHYLVSRVHTRETSTLTISAIASSASIILFGLYFSDLTDQEKNIIFWIGILSPIIGFSYYEITFGTQQSWDYDNINKIIDDENTTHEKDELNEIIYGKKRAQAIPKQVLWRILLAIPIVGWLSLTVELGWYLLIIITTGVTITLMTYRGEAIKNKKIAEQS